MMLNSTAPSTPIDQWEIRSQRFVYCNSLGISWNDDMRKRPFASLHLLQAQGFHPDSFPASLLRRISGFLVGHAGFDSVVMSLLAKLIASQVSIRCCLFFSKSYLRYLTGFSMVSAHDQQKLLPNCCPLEPNCIYLCHGSLQVTVNQGSEPLQGGGTAALKCGVL